ncbi:MAG: hypothetical protein ACR2NM_00995, partial [Bythopirellula sp.]
RKASRVAWPPSAGNPHAGKWRESTLLRQRGGSGTPLPYPLFTHALVVGTECRIADSYRAAVQACVGKTHQSLSTGGHFHLR